LDAVKILIANTLYFPDQVGGAEVSTQLLAEGLLKAGVEVCVVCATGTGTDRVDVLNGVKIYRLRSANLYWPHGTGKHSRVAKLLWHAIDVCNIVMSRKLSNILENEKPDVIHTSNLACLSIDLWRIARRSEIPIVHTARDYYLMCPTAIMFSNGKACERQCGLCSVYAQPKRAASSRVEVAVGVSKFVLDKHLESGFFSEATRTAVISNCFVPFGEAPPAVRSRRYTGGPVRLGVLGRVSQDKGLEILLEQLLADDTLDWTLAIGGGGDPDYIESLKTKFGDPRVEFLGRVKPGAFLESIDILVVPSVWHEPFGRVTIEAYSYGVPVVGANTGGIPEVVEPRSNLVFDIHQPHTLIGKLREAVALLADPAVHDRMREHAARFNVDTMVKEYIDVYQSALGGRPSLECESLPLGAASE
jgi:glycosyltransferase involved in cell wall biosynthesis